MAVGDRTPTELIVPAALSNAISTQLTNQGASFRTQMTQIVLNVTGATKRIVSLYKNGTAAANNIMNIVLDPTTNGSATAIIEVPLVFTGAQTLSAKQDVGADVTISAYGIVEQIA